MANYFTHFSCLLDVGTPDNAARALDLYNQLSLGSVPINGFMFLTVCDSIALKGDCYAPS
jgi:hypothetical protein